MGRFVHITRTIRDRIESPVPEAYVEGVDENTLIAPTDTQRYQIVKVANLAGQPLPGGEVILAEKQIQANGRLAVTTSQLSFYGLGIYEVRWLQMDGSIVGGETRRLAVGSLTTSDVDERIVLTVPVDPAWRNYTWDAGRSGLGVVSSQKQFDAFQKGVEGTGPMPSVLLFTLDASILDPSLPGMYHFTAFSDAQAQRVAERIAFNVEIDDRRGEVQTETRTLSPYEAAPSPVKFVAMPSAKTVRYEWVQVYNTRAGGLNPVKPRVVVPRADVSVDNNTGFRSASPLEITVRQHGTDAGLYEFRGYDASGRVMVQRQSYRLSVDDKEVNKQTIVDRYYNSQDETSVPADIVFEIKTFPEVKTAEWRRTFSYTTSELDGTDATKEGVPYERDEFQYPLGVAALGADGVATLTLSAEDRFRTPGEYVFEGKDDKGDVVQTAYFVARIYALCQRSKEWFVLGQRLRKFGECVWLAHPKVYSDKDRKILSKQFGSLLSKDQLYVDEKKSLFFCDYPDELFTYKGLIDFYNNNRATQFNQSRITNVDDDLLPEELAKLNDKYGLSFDDDVSGIICPQPFKATRDLDLDDPVFRVLLTMAYNELGIFDEYHVRFIDAMLLNFRSFAAMYEELATRDRKIAKTSGLSKLIGKSVARETANKIAAELYAMTYDDIQGSDVWAEASQRRFDVTLLDRMFKDHMGLRHQQQACRQITGKMHFDARSGVWSRAAAQKENRGYWRGFFNENTDQPTLYTATRRGSERLDWGVNFEALHDAIRSKQLSEEDRTALIKLFNYLGHFQPKRRPALGQNAIDTVKDIPPQLLKQFGGDLSSVIPRDVGGGGGGYGTRRGRGIVGGDGRRARDFAGSLFSTLFSAYRPLTGLAGVSSLDDAFAAADGYAYNKGAIERVAIEQSDWIAERVLNTQTFTNFATSSSYLDVSRDSPLDITTLRDDDGDIPLIPGAYKYHFGQAFVAFFNAFDRLYSGRDPLTGKVAAMFEFENTSKIDVDVNAIVQEYLDALHTFNTYSLFTFARDFAIDSFITQLQRLFSVFNAYSNTAGVTVSNANRQSVLGVVTNIVNNSAFTPVFGFVTEKQLRPFLTELFVTFDLLSESAGTDINTPQFAARRKQFVDAAEILRTVADATQNYVRGMYRRSLKNTDWYTNLLAQLSQPGSDLYRAFFENGLLLLAANREHEWTWDIILTNMFQYLRSFRGDTSLEPQVAVPENALAWGKTLMNATFAEVGVADWVGNVGNKHDDPLNRNQANKKYFEFKVTDSEKPFAAPVGGKLEELLESWTTSVAEASERRARALKIQFTKDVVDVTDTLVADNKAEFERARRTRTTTTTTPPAVDVDAAVDRFTKLIIGYDDDEKRKIPAGVPTRLSSIGRNRNMDAAASQANLDVFVDSQETFEARTTKLLGELTVKDYGADAETIFQRAFAKYTELYAAREEIIRAYRARLVTLSDDSLNFTGLVENVLNKPRGQVNVSMDPVRQIGQDVRGHASVRELATDRDRLERQWKLVKQTYDVALKQMAPDVTRMPEAEVIAAQQAQDELQRLFRSDYEATYLKIKYEIETKLANLQGVTGARAEDKLRSRVDDIVDKAGTSSAQFFAQYATFDFDNLTDANAQIAERLRASGQTIDQEIRQQVAEFEQALRTTSVQSVSDAAKAQIQRDLNAQLQLVVGVLPQNIQSLTRFKTRYDQSVRDQRRRATQGGLTERIKNAMDTSKDVTDEDANLRNGKLVAYLRVPGSKFTNADASDDRWLKSGTEMREGLTDIRKLLTRNEQLSVDEERFFVPYDGDQQRLHRTLNNLAYVVFESIGRRQDLEREAVDRGVDENQRVFLYKNFVVRGIQEWFLKLESDGETRTASPGDLLQLVEFIFPHGPGRKTLLPEHKRLVYEFFGWMFWRLTMGSEGFSEWTEKYAKGEQQVEDFLSDIKSPMTSVSTVRSSESTSVAAWGVWFAIQRVVLSADDVARSGRANYPEFEVARRYIDHLAKFVFERGGYQDTTAAFFPRASPTQSDAGRFLDAQRQYIEQDGDIPKYWTAIASPQKITGVWKQFLRFLADNYNGLVDASGRDPKTMSTAVSRPAYVTSQGKLSDAFKQRWDDMVSQLDSLYSESELNMTINAMKRHLVLDDHGEFIPHHSEALLSDIDRVRQGLLAEEFGGVPLDDYNASIVDDMTAVVQQRGTIATTEKK